jgi:hypothetical protein
MERISIIDLFYRPDIRQLVDERILLVSLTAAPGKLF